MTRRTFFKIFPIAGFAAAFGIKLKAEPKKEFNFNTNQKNRYVNKHVSGSIREITVNGETFSVGPDQDFDYVNFS